MVREGDYWGEPEPAVYAGFRSGEEPEILEVGTMEGKVRTIITTDRTKIHGADGRHVDHINGGRDDHFEGAAEEIESNNGTRYQQPQGSYRTDNTGVSTGKRSENGDNGGRGPGGSGSERRHVEGDVDVSRSRD